MKITFTRVDDGLFEFKTSSGSYIKVFNEGVDEDLPLLWNWRWFYELHLSEAALKAVAKRNKKKINKDTSNVLIEDSLQVHELYEDAMKELCNTIGRTLNATITFEVKL